MANAGRRLVQHAKHSCSAWRYAATSVPVAAWLQHLSADHCAISIMRKCCFSAVVFLFSV